MTANPLQAGGGLRYRPLEYDDWGIIRHPAPDDTIFAVVRRPVSEDEAAEHRRNGTDPYEKLALRLIAASTPAPSGLAGEAVAKPLKERAAQIADQLWLDTLEKAKLIRLIEREFAVPPSIPAGGVREAAKVKPLDLSAILRDAFLTGRGLKDGDKLSEEDQAAWMAYDPTEHNAYKRIEALIRAPLSLPAGGVAAAPAPEGVDWRQFAGWNSIPIVTPASVGVPTVSEAMVERAVEAAIAAIWTGPDEANAQHFAMRKALESALSPEAKTGERS